MYMLLFQIMLTFNMSQLKPVSYGTYQYPIWAILIGWIIGMASVVPIPIQAVIGLCKSNGSLLQVCFLFALWSLDLFHIMQHPKHVTFWKVNLLSNSMFHGVLWLCVYIEIAIFDRFYFTWHHAYNSCALHFHRNLKCKKVLFEWNIKSDKKCMKWHNIIRTTVYFLRQTHLTDSYINDESVPRKQRD